MKFLKIGIMTAVIGGVFVAGLMAGMNMQTADAAPANSSRIYELRTYTTNDGKLDNLHARFADHTNHLFVKHNMTLVGYWTPTEGDKKDNTLVYIIGHESREAAKDNWKAFGSDEAWRKAYADSKADGPLVKKVESVFLNPTDYSPLR